LGTSRSRERVYTLYSSWMREHKPKKTKKTNNKKKEGDGGKNGGGRKEELVIYIFKLQGGKRGKFTGGYRHETNSRDSLNTYSHSRPLHKK